MNAWTRIVNEDHKRKARESKSTLLTDEMGYPKKLTYSEISALIKDRPQGYRISRRKVSGPVGVTNSRYEATLLFDGVNYRQPTGPRPSKPVMQACSTCFMVPSVNGSCLCDW